ncbi:MAG: hypothetical protein PHD48_06280 [Alphaproteobacteria bacterium]|nr:hypothetical protein [Alphaproteobacteria bacterium]
MADKTIMMVFNYNGCDVSKLKSLGLLPSKRKVGIRTSRKIVQEQAVLYTATVDNLSPLSVRDALNAGISVELDDDENVAGQHFLVARKEKNLRDFLADKKIDAEVVTLGGCDVLRVTRAPRLPLAKELVAIRNGIAVSRQAQGCEV